MTSVVGVDPTTLAIEDHARGRRKNGVGIAHALDMDWRNLTNEDAETLVRLYETAWWVADAQEVPA